MYIPSIGNSPQKSPQLPAETTAHGRDQALHSTQKEPVKILLYTIDTDPLEFLLTTEALKV